MNRGSSVIAAEAAIQKCVDLDTGFRRYGDRGCGVNRGYSVIAAEAAIQKCVDLDTGFRRYGDRGCGVNRGYSVIAAEAAIQESPGLVQAPLVLQRQPGTQQRPVLDTGLRRYDKLPGSGGCAPGKRGGWAGTKSS